MNLIYNQPGVLATTVAFDILDDSSGMTFWISMLGIKCPWHINNTYLRNGGFPQRAIVSRKHVQNNQHLSKQWILAISSKHPMAFSTSYYKPMKKAI